MDSSTFLGSHEGFWQSNRLEGSQTYIAPSVNFQKYKNIYIAPIEVLSATPKSELSHKQRLLSQQITEYITKKYRELMAQQISYRVVDTPNHPETMIFEGSISSVLVEFDELSGMSYMPMMFVGTMLARATVADGKIRVLGEGRLKDASTGKVLIQMMRLHKGKEVEVDAEDLVFEDVKPVIDDWLRDSSSNIGKIRAGILQR